MKLRRKLSFVVLVVGISACGGSKIMPLTVESVNNLNNHVDVIELTKAYEPCRNSSAKKELEALNLNYTRDYFYDWFEGGEVLPQFKQDLENHERHISQLTQNIESEKPMCDLNASKVISKLFIDSGYDFEASIKDVFSSTANYTRAQKLGIVDTILPILATMKSEAGEKMLIENSVISKETAEYIKSQTVTLNKLASAQ
jgi:hypothetical protein